MDMVETSHKQFASLLGEIGQMRNDFKEHIQDDKKRFDAFDNQLVMMNSNIEEILGIMKAFSLGKSFLMGLGVLIGTIVAIVVGLKQIVGWLS